MFNRLMRCLSLVRMPLNVSSSLRSPIITSENSRPKVTCDLLLKNRFCTVVSKPSELQIPADNKTEVKNELTLAMEADPTLEKRYKIIQLEVDVMRQTGKRVPTKLRPQEWLQLLKEETRSARRKYLQYLFVTEKKQENEMGKKLAARIEREKLWESEEYQTCPYRLHKTSMFLRIYDSTMNHFYHCRLIQAIMFGFPLVIDCGFHSHMTMREITECTKQLAYLFSQNRIHPDPFALHFCNVDKSSVLMQRLQRIIPTMYEPDFPITISEKSYMETFDKKKLVYLTPHTHNEMQSYDPDSVYIIGAMVDKTNSEPLTLAKAKKEGLKMAKLPLDKYLLWAPGSGKRLPLNQMVNILADVKLTGDWQKALKHVPSRKLEKALEKSDVDVPKRTMQYKQNTRSFEPSQKKFQKSFNFKARQKRVRGDLEFED